MSKLAQKSRLPALLLLLLAFFGGLAITRLLFEWRFPSWLWLGRPVIAFLLAALAAGVTLWFFRWRRDSHYGWFHVTLLLPLAFNLIYLFDPTVDLVRGRLLMTAGIWLLMLLGVHQGAQREFQRWWDFILITAALLPVYLLTMPTTVGRADTFEFQVVVPQLGIAHPTGYPLYMLLGKLFTLVPFGSMAWRLNLASAVFAVVGANLVFLSAVRILGKPLPAILAAVTVGLSPTLWSQAVEAEVYALHAVFVAFALFLMVHMIGANSRDRKNRWSLLLAAWIGLALTNHLTSLFLLPPAAISLVLVHWPAERPRKLTLGRLLAIVVAFLLPLLLYLYLPLRWAAVNGEPMGFGRFVDWVVGGRFQEALQWRAWLNDPIRYQIIGRLFLDEWGYVNLLLALFGSAFLARRNRRVLLVLLVTWLGFTFYALNYTVPDLAVFLIPSHLVVGILWAAGLAGLIDALNHLSRRLMDGMGSNRDAIPVTYLVTIVAVMPLVLTAVAQWDAIDNSQKDGLTAWGKGVLEMPLDADAAILADSEKIAPLYYLQQSEGLRPDLDITVLPDEASYRSQLDTRLAAGQTVYLARFLPGLEGFYHLRSKGPLTEVSTEPLTALPDDASSTEMEFGSIRLVGYALEEAAAVDESMAAVTLFWQADEAPQEVLHVFVRWANDGFAGEPEIAAGQHPANNYYPTVAWDPGEIVSDYHLVSVPISSKQQQLDLQVTLAPPFSATDTLEWRTVTEFSLPPARPITLEQPVRAHLGQFLMDSTEFPSQLRPGSELPITFTGYGDGGEELQFELRPLNAPIMTAENRPSELTSRSASRRTIHRSPISIDLPNGRYQLFVRHQGDSAICGWLDLPSDGCSLGEVEVSGVPLPEGAVNFADKFALLEVKLPETELRPGGQLAVELTWRSLASVKEDYTVFVQVLDSQDSIAGQVDSWPVQGTYGTSQWSPGETVADRYLVQLGNDLLPGDYRLQVGWYLLGTLQRLPVLDDTGAPVDDKVARELYVP